MKRIDQLYVVHVVGQPLNEPWIFRRLIGAPISRDGPAIVAIIESLLLLLVRDKIRAVRNCVFCRIKPVDSECDRNPRDL